ncbi:MAG: N-acetyltransferase [Lewinellaceae bacterium]|nr:N-acetyltransferase [Saprospiraceae bacterium]MCB9336803.1 N-acetyltransferase [Lewinellaceae bacterium]
MQVIIRSATLSDAAPLAAIYNQCVGISTLDLVQRDSDHFRNILASLEENEALLVLEHEGDLAGYGILKRYSWKEGYRFAGETSVFMDEKYRGKGLGNLLKKTLIETAEALGYKHLVARILARNTVSIHYNQKLGYEMVGHQKRIGYVDGEWLDVAILQLFLPASEQGKQGAKVEL